MCVYVYIHMYTYIQLYINTKETFETNLSASQKEETADQKAYEDLKAAKEEEIAAGQAQIDAKTAELADTDEKNAHSKEDLEDTKTSLSADEEFLMMLKESGISKILFSPFYESF